jgi:hypothetical protein
LRGDGAFGAGSVGSGGGDLFGSSHGVGSIHPGRKKCGGFWRDVVEGRGDSAGVRRVMTKEGVKQIV